jgi:polyphenol oxidase
MIDSPFKIFEPFNDRLDIRFFDKTDNVRTDADVAEKIGSDSIASLHQAHADRSIIVANPMSRLEKADALATDAKNLWLTIRAADCQQLIVYAPEKNAVALIHAGWKGLNAGIIPSLFKLLKDEWNIDASETFVGIGPSLCLKCAEFTDPIIELEGLDPKFFHGRNADLQAIADDQLDKAGVPKSQQERMEGCTKCSSDIFWSYRGGDREKVIQGYTDVLTCKLAASS